MKSVIAASVVAAASADKINLSFSDCGDASTKGHITGLSPTSITTGQKTSLAGTGTLDVDVTSGSYTLDVKALGVTLKSCTGDICGSASCDLPMNTGTLEFKGLACPVSAGPVEIDIDATVSESIPSQLAVLDITLKSDGLLCAAIHTSPGAVGSGDYQSEWADFQAVQGARNGDVPEAFKANVDYVKSINAQNLGFTLSWTGPMAAMSQDELKETLGYKPQDKWGGQVHLGSHVHNGEPLAASVDWVTQGAVTKVKDQGQCGSCWAFSTTGATEGAWQLASGKLKSLSEQQLVDCSKANAGCQGGSMESAFQFLEGVGTCSEQSYPYKAAGGTCTESSCTVEIQKGDVTGYQTVGGFFGATEQDLMSAVQKNPVSIAIEADQRAFQTYSTGILSSGCGTNLDHGVLAVGYGTQGSQDYWMIKNSWGTSWGEAGYGKLLRGAGGQGVCGILADASYPVVSASVAV